MIKNVDRLQPHQELSNSLGGIEEIISRAERIIGQDRSPGKRESCCGWLSALLGHSLEYLSPQEKRAGIEVIKIINTWQLFLAAQGYGKEEIIKEHQKYVDTLDSDLIKDALFQAFTHAILAFRVSKQWYIGDLSYCQFLDQTKKTIESGADIGVAPDDEFVQQLIKNGIFAATPENLRHYIERTVDKNYHKLILEIISNEDVERILNNTPAVVDSYDKSELDVIFEK
jgi:hypothetical protein